MQKLSGHFGQHKIKSYLVGNFYVVVLVKDVHDVLIFGSCSWSCSEKFGLKLCGEGREEGGGRGGYVLSVPFKRESEVEA